MAGCGAGGDSLSMACLGEVRDRIGLPRPAYLRRRSASVGRCGGSAIDRSATVHLSGRGGLMRPKPCLVPEPL